MKVIISYALQHKKINSLVQQGKQYCAGHNSILKFILFGLSFLFYQKGNTQTTNIWADSCISSSFYGKIESPGYSDFSQVHAYPGGDLILVGTAKDNFAQLAISRNYGNIMRITSAGDSVWSRFIGINDPAVQVDLRTYASVVASNGDIVVVTTISAASLSGNFMFRLNGSGDIVWQKSIPYFDPGSPSEIFSDIIETSDKGFLITGSRPNEAMFMKIDMNGNYVWRNRLIGGDFMPNINAVTEGLTAFYISGTGTVPGTGYSGNYIAKAEKIIGDIGFVKWINFSGIIPLSGFTEYEFDKMNFKDGVIALTGNTSLNYAGPNRNAQIAVYMDETGNVLSSTRIENLDTESDAAYMFQGSLYDPFMRTGAQSHLADNNNYYVYRLKEDHTAEWAWKIPLTNVHGAMDSKLLNDSSLVVAGISRDANNIVSANVLKTAISGKLENCINQPFPLVISTLPVSLQDVPNLFESPGNNNDQTATSVLDIINGNGFTWQLQCSNTTVCKISKIAGVKTVCKDSSNLFSVTRNGNCNNPISFSSNGPITIINNSDSSANISFSTEGIFVLYAKMQSSCGVLKDSMIVHVKKPGISFSLGPDTTICPRNTIMIKVSGDYDSYLWQDGSTDSVYTVTNPGTYYITVKDACGKIFRDTVKVIAAPAFEFSIGNDRIKCNADTLHINGPAGFSNYNWSPDFNISSIHSQNIIIKPQVDTSYTVIAERSPGCLAFDTVKVRVKRSPIIQLGSDTTICMNDTLLLNAGPGFVSYLWNDGKTTAFNLINQPGVYSVKANYANGCQSSATIKINNELCLDDIYIPAAFTPNNDGVNDKFKPRVYLPLSQYHFEIFTRWGQKVFESYDINQGWDGKIKEADAGINVLVWICKYQFTGKDLKLKKGTVILMK